MRIENLRRENRGDRVRRTATVVWEDSDRSPLELFFETDGAASAHFEPGPDAFLLACVLPAFSQDEKRLRIEGEICPRLHDGVIASMALLGSWYRPAQPLVRLEATEGFRPARPSEDRAALFATGGVDSLHTLWWNRRNYPRGHPASIRAALHVAGLSFPETPPSDRSLDLTERSARALRAIAEGEGFETLWIHTNVRQLEPDLWFLNREAHGAVLASCAHAFAKGITSAYLASSIDVTQPRPWGTHPLLDPNYSSCAVEILHDHPSTPRLEKLRAISGWTGALENLLVCFEGPLPDDRLNCGECEKCMRTMVALLALGRLEAARAFPKRRLDPGDVDRVYLGYHPELFEYNWMPSLGPLRAAGRQDIARAVERKIEEARRYERWAGDLGWKGRLRRIDKRVFGGRFQRLRRAFR